MRKKLAVVVGLVAVVLAVTVPPLAVSLLRPTDPPLRVGMTQEEVHQVFGERCPRVNISCGMGKIATEAYMLEPGRFGNCESIYVYYDDGRVIEWKNNRKANSRPSWLDRMLKAVGWE